MCFLNLIKKLLHIVIQFFKNKLALYFLITIISNKRIFFWIYLLVIKISFDPHKNFDYLKCLKIYKKSRFDIKQKNKPLTLHLSHFCKSICFGDILLYIYGLKK